jgi:hypothetical protein
VLWLYPNPGYNEIWFSHPELISSVELYDPSGVLVLSSADINPIDISKLANGLYFVRVFIDEHSEQILKFIKQ